jgi:hypothetical protein
VRILGGIQAQRAGEGVGAHTGTVSIDSRPKFTVKLAGCTIATVAQAQILRHADRLVWLCFFA